MDISVYVRQWIYYACNLLNKAFSYIYTVVLKTICNLFFVYNYFNIYIKIVMIIIYIICVHVSLLRL